MSLWDQPLPHGPNMPGKTESTFPPHSILPGRSKLAGQAYVGIHPPKQAQTRSERVWTSLSGIRRICSINSAYHNIQVAKSRHFPQNKLLGPAFLQTNPNKRHCGFYPAVGGQKRRSLDFSKELCRNGNGGIGYVWRKSKLSSHQIMELTAFFF